MPAKKPARKASKQPRAKRQPPSRRASSRGGIAVAGDIKCADFVGRDQVTQITYGFTAADVEKLIEKVLTFLQRGATFIPTGEALRAEVDGDALTFRPGAVQQLAGSRSEKSYLLSLTVRREYQVWATKFIPLAAQMDVKRSAEALDMPVAFSEFRVPREGEGPEARVTSVPLADITEAIDKHAAFVILGEPGAGKTTTLQKIAFETARTLLSDGSGRVPLFVRLSQQANRTPFDFLAAEWGQKTGSDFADALAAGRVLLLADGVNELPRDERDERLKAWRLFAGDHCQANQIVFTGREKDYEGQLNLPRVRVEPLDDERIADYLQRNEAEGLGDLLDDPKTRLREMARNPFNLALLAFAYKHNQRDMGNRGRLLEWFAGELFAREEWLAHKGWIRRDAQVHALAQLAHAMQAQGEGTTFPLKAARAALPPSVEIDGEDIAIAPADLFRFARAATILDPAVEPDVRFYHHLLQEYFAALELLRRFEEGEDLGGLWTAPRRADEMPAAKAGEWDPLPEPPSTGWEVTTILACGLALDPARLIEAMRLHNPVLAGRCLDEAGVYQSDDPSPFIRFAPASVAPLAQRVRDDLQADLYSPAVHLRARLQAGLALGRIGDPRFEPQIVNGVKVILPKMVPVPAGKYTIGSEDDTAAYDDEKPQHPAELAAFTIGKWPVTNAEFACFIEAGGYKDERHWKTDLAKRWLAGEDVTGGPMTSWLEWWKWLTSNPDWRERLERDGGRSPDALKTFEYMSRLNEKELHTWLTGWLKGKSRERPHYWNDAQYANPSQPVVGVTWFEARAYCEWLSHATGRVYCLPSEAEWETAARGAEARRYPWGDNWDAARANTIEGRVLKPSPVGAYAAAGGAGPFDAEDQSGNVWNWTSSLYRPYPYSLDDREDPNAEGERTVRGGSWSDYSGFARCACRGRVVPGNFNDDVGFRVVSPGSISGF
jgi:formylglycine-generating enzyme required for sulfatase activity